MTSATATAETLPSPNRYLQGNMAPVREEVTATELAVTGTIPAHLDGRYVRNGPNPVTDVDPATYHWFVGSGMVHGVRLRDGRAEWYRNRWVRSADVAAALGEDPNPGPMHAGMDYSPNTHVIGHAGRTFAIVEAGGLPYELTAELDTIGSCDFDGTLPGGYTAHPLLDPATGELHAVSYYWGWERKVRYSVLGTDTRIKRTVDVPVAGSPMMHAFSLTGNHVVLYDLPVTFDLAKVERGMSMPYTWDPTYAARVGVMDRDGDGSDLRWFEVEPCYVYHPLNAYDEGDRVVLDVVRHPKMFATDHHGPNDGRPTLDRWTVDLAGGKVLEERLDDRAQEFPRVDDRLTGRRHRYGYATGSVDDADGRIDFRDSGLLKHDFATGSSELRTFGPGCEAGEFVFVPDAPDSAEDDGLLMGYVYDPQADRSDLVLLDAASLDTVARVHLPARVPTGFHGSWIPST